VNTVATQTGRDIKFIDPMAPGSPFTPDMNGCSTSLQRYMNGPNDGSNGAWHPNIYGAQYYEALLKASLS